jgi:hypothetical protein
LRRARAARREEGEGRRLEGVLRRQHDAAVVQPALRARARESSGGGGGSARYQGLCRTRRRANSSRSPRVCARVRARAPRTPCRAGRARRSATRRCCPGGAAARSQRATRASVPQRQRTHGYRGGRPPSRRGREGKKARRAPDAPPRAPRLQRLAHEVAALVRGQLFVLLSACARERKRGKRERARARAAALRVTPPARAHAPAAAASPPGSSCSAAPRPWRPLAAGVRRCARGGAPRRARRQKQRCEHSLSLPRHQPKATSGLRRRPRARRQAAARAPAAALRAVSRHAGETRRRCRCSSGADDGRAGRPHPRAVLPARAAASPRARCPKASHHAPCRTQAARLPPSSRARQAGHHHGGRGARSRSSRK